MAWTTTQYKAIFSYAKRNELRVQMSSSVGLNPKVTFIKLDASKIQIPISEIVSSETTSQKEEAKERKRIKQEEERRKSWQERFKQD